MQVICHDKLEFIELELERWFCMMSSLTSLLALTLTLMSFHVSVADVKAFMNNNGGEDKKH